MPRPDLDALPTIIVAPPASGDAGPMINQAIQSVTFNGTRPGRVVLLSGTYTIITQVRMVSNLVLQGQADWSAQLINQQVLGGGGFGIAIFVYQDYVGNAVTNIALVDMYVDIASTGNFMTAIRCDDVVGIWIEHCFFDNTIAPPWIQNNPWTIHAVLFAGSCDDMVVTRCRTKYSQIKTGTSGTASGVCEVSYNYCENPTNFGFSHVMQVDGQLGHYRAIGNYVKDPFGQGGFYVGTDSTIANYGTILSATIENNIIDGAWMASGNAVGITFRPPRQTGDVLIAGNVVVNRTTGSLPNNGFGINIKAEVRGTNVARIGLHDNYVEYTDLNGILVATNCPYVELYRNRCYRTRVPQILCQTAVGSPDELRVFSHDEITPVTLLPRAVALSS